MSFLLDLRCAADVYSFGYNDDREKYGELLLKRLRDRFPQDKFTIYDHTLGLGDYVKADVKECICADMTFSWYNIWLLLDGLKETRNRIKPQIKEISQYSHFCMSELKREESDK